MQEVAIVAVRGLVTNKQLKGSLALLPEYL